MNILYLTGNLGIGGTELYALDYAKSMRSIGHTVLWASIKTGPMKEIINKEKIQLLHCSFEHRLPLSFLRAILQLRKYCKVYKIDVIHAIDAYTALVAVCAFKNIKKRPKLIWSSVGIGSKSYTLMKKICEKDIDIIITVSQFIRNRMIEEGFDPKKLIPYSQSREMIDSNFNRDILRQEFGFKENDFVIGTIGRLAYMKGNRTVVLAMKDLIEKRKNIKLLVVGDGPDRKELEKLSQELGVQNNVIFTGFRTDIENMYAIFDIVAFPTYYEALGYIPFEAMYYEKPIVASYTGGIPEVIIDGYNGILVPPAMEEEWTKAFIRIIEDKEFYEKLKMNGKKYYNLNLKRDKTYKKLENIYLK